MSSGYNELKLELLEEAVKWETVTAGDMAKALGRTPNSISKAMSRYHHMGLLSRYTIYRNEKVYSLTDRGRERLEWLLEQVSIDSDDDDVFDEEDVEDDDEAEDEEDEVDFESLSEIDKEIYLFEREEEAENKDENISDLHKDIVE